MTLNATDNDKVASTEYRLNDGEWSVYTAPVALVEGENMLDFRSTDATGNREPATSTTVKVDTQVPTVSAVVDADARIITVKAADSGSGVATVEYSTDGGTTWQAYTAAIEAGDDGVSVAYRAADNAGLVAASTADAVIAPVVTTEPAAPSLSAPASVVVGAEFTVDAKDLVAGESYELWIHSDPVKLATVKAGEDGAASVKVSIPAAFAAGAHELTLEREGSVVARTAIVVRAAIVDPPVTETPEPTDTSSPKPTIPAGNDNAGNDSAGNDNAASADSNGDLASTGAKVMLLAGIALLLVLGGGVALVITRRRRA